MDLTAWCIASGLVAAVIHAFLKALRHGHQDASAFVTIFVGAATFPMALSCIVAALHGDKQELPTAWREYLAFAGAVAILLTLGSILRAYRAVLRAPARASNPEGVADADLEGG